MPRPEAQAIQPGQGETVGPLEQPPEQGGGDALAPAWPGKVSGAGGPGG
jgi:hypothetical protein